MGTLNEEIIDFLSTAPLSEEDRARLISRAKVSVNQKLVAEIDAALNLYFKELAKQDLEGAAMIEEIEKETNSELRANWMRFDKEAKLIEKEEDDAYQQANQEIDRLDLEEVKKEIQG